MDFLGIIQWVMDVQQFPDSHKEEIDKLKTECSNLSSLIKMIGEDELPVEQRNQIKKHLEEAESLLKNVPRKAGLVQSFISMLPGQQTIQKLKEASDNIHRTSNNLNAWLNVRMYQTKVIEQVDLKISKVKKLNSNDSTNDILNDNNTKKASSEIVIPATLVDQLDPTFQGQEGDDNDNLFHSLLNVSLILDRNQNIYEIFEQNRINTKEVFAIKKEPKQITAFTRVTYQNLCTIFNDVNRISREHAVLELIEVQTTESQHHSNSNSAVTLQVPLSTSEKNAINQNNSQSDRLKTASKEEDQFATCVEVFSDGDGDDAFEQKQTPLKKQNLYFIAVECRGPNGIFVYRKRENEPKQDEIAAKKLLNKIKLIDAGSWTKISKGERALVFNNDSIAILKCDKITISYTIKID